jgi:hypothetical protein
MRMMGGKCFNKRGQSGRGREGWEEDKERQGRAGGYRKKERKRRR